MAVPNLKAFDFQKGGEERAKIWGGAIRDVGKIAGDTVREINDPENEMRELKLAEIKEKIKTKEDAYKVSIDTLAEVKLAEEVEAGKLNTTENNEDVRSIGAGDTLAPASRKDEEIFRGPPGRTASKLAARREEIRKELEERYGPTFKGWSIEEHRTFMARYAKNKYLQEQQRALEKKEGRKGTIGTNANNIDLLIHGKGAPGEAAKADYEKGNKSYYLNLAKTRIAEIKKDNPKANNKDVVGILLKDEILTPEIIKEAVDLSKQTTASPEDQRADRSLDLEQERNTISDFNAETGRMNANTSRMRANQEKERLKVEAKKIEIANRNRQDPEYVKYATLADRSQKGIALRLKDAKKRKEEGQIKRLERMQLSYEFQALAASNADGKVSVKEINAASIELRYIDNYSEFEKWKDDNPGIYTLGNAHEILFEDLEIELSQEEANNSQLPEGVEIEFGDKKKGNIRTETTPKEERWLRDDIEASKKIVLEVPPELRTIELNEAISRAKRVKYNVGKTVGDRAQIFIKFKGVDGETSLEEFEADRKGIQPQATSGGQATAGDTTAVDTATTPSDSSAAPDSASSVVQPPAQDSASLNVQPAAADTLDLTGRSGPEIARERLKPENQGKIIMYEGQRLVPKKQE